MQKAFCNIVLRAHCIILPSHLCFWARMYSKKSDHFIVTPITHADSSHCPFGILWRYRESHLPLRIRPPPLTTGCDQLKPRKIRRRTTNRPIRRVHRSHCYCHISHTHSTKLISIYGCLDEDTATNLGSV